MSPKWKLSGPIVGMYYRPPAEIIIRLLPANAPLALIPEPTNPYDGNAVQVWCKFASAILDDQANIDLQLFPYGTNCAELALQEDIHLGYIAKTHSKMFATALAEAEKEGLSITCKLGFSMTGKPEALLSLEPTP